MRQEMRGVSYFYVVGRDPDGCGNHTPVRMPVRCGTGESRFARFADAIGQITRTLSIPAMCQVLLKSCVRDTPARSLFSTKSVVYEW
jgi:hypothetical protein